MPMNGRLSSCKEAIASFRLTVNGQRVPYGVGCAWIGRNRSDRGATVREVGMLHRAYELGFRYFDTSRQYGESEFVVGEFVGAVPRTSIFLATKTPLPPDATPQQAAQLVRRNLEESLCRLKTDYVDLFQLHDIGTLHNVLDEDDVLRLLLELRQHGVIRNFGLATRDLRLLDRAARTGFDTVLTYSDFTPLEQPAAELIATTRQLGTGLINGSPLSAGLLTGADPSGKPRLDDEFERRRRKAKSLFELCGMYGVSVRTLALQFPLRNEDIDITLTGPATEEELLSTVRSLQKEITQELWDAWEEWNQTVNGARS